MSTWVGSAGTYTTASAPVSVTLPAGWQPGDLAILVVSSDSNVDQAWPAPSGWTFRAKTAAGNMYSYIWSRVLQAGDTTVGMTLGSGTFVVGVWRDAVLGTIGTFGIRSGTIFTATSPNIGDTGYRAHVFAERSTAASAGEADTLHTLAYGTARAFYAGNTTLSAANGISAVYFSDSAPGQSGDNTATFKDSSTNAWGLQIGLGSGTIPVPVASFTTDKTTITAGEAVQFTDTSTNTPTSWSWNFGAGGPASVTTKSPLVTFPTAGTYNVVLTATNASGSGVSSPTTITVNAAPSTSVPTISGWTTAVPLGAGDTATLDPSANVASGAVANNDWIIAVIVSSGAYSTSRKPTMTGWTTLFAFAQINASATACFGLYARKRTAGDSTYTVSQSTAESVGTYHRMIFVRGADDASKWVVGAFKDRVQNATSATAVGDAILTTLANSLGLAIAAERTVAAETDAQISVSNFTKIASMVEATDAINVYGTKSLAAAGSSGAVTFTFPNTHANNGIAGILGIPPSAGGAAVGMAIKVSDGTQLKDSLLQVSTGSALYTPRGIKKVQPGYATVTAMLGTKFYCAHRGGSRDWPEMSAFAYGQSVLQDYGALELSLARTSDGVWFGLHDQYLDRTSLGTATTTLDPANMTWAQVQGYQILGSTAVNKPAQPNRPYMRFEELMAVYYDSHIIFVDPKVAYNYRAELLNMMDAMPGNPRERFVGKYYGVSGGAANTSGWAYDLAQRGYQSWGYFYDADQANFATYAGRWTFLGMDYTASQAGWDALKAAAPGKKIMGHICPDAAAVATATTKGANGFMVSSPNNVRPI